MILGHGDIAGALNDREGAIFFASGVSNSSEKNQAVFELEYQKLKKLAGDDRSLFYFSSIATQLKKMENQNPYFKHKILMETCVKAWFDNYNIIRIGNITFGSNPNTFLNYIRNKKAKGEPVEIRDEWKYMISKEQLLLLTDNLPLTGKNEISVFGECKKVIDCL